MDKRDKSFFTPREIVSELDKYIIGQNDAKKAVAVALRNRWRRLQVSDDLRDEIAPKNILMIGPTGVGKTEIARRLAKLAASPFIKVEATKFTEVGYVGKDVESMIRELVELSVKMIRAEEQERIEMKANDNAEEKLLDLLLGKNKKKNETPPPVNPMDSVTNALGAIMGQFGQFGGPAADTTTPPADNVPPSKSEPEEFAQESREELREKLRDGKLDNRSVELEVAPQMPMIEIISPGGPMGMEEMGMNIKEMMSSFMPKQKKKKKVKVPEAYQILQQEEMSKLLDMDSLIKKAIERVEQNGIVFLDEIDKIAGREGGSGPDVSREGVQRDILPIVEGSNVNTKYGMVKTDHILFIAAGAFHVSKPSDLIPELQGRFPLRVELQSLTKDDFLRILTEPQNSLIKQYTELMKTEGLQLEYTPEALESMASFAAQVNERTENIGARRLHTILEKVIEDISFTAPEISDKKVVIDAAYVQERLSNFVKDVDLSRYIL